MGRVAILKSLVLSKLIHLWILLPNPPDVFIQKLQKMCFCFVWNGKQDRIGRKTSIKTERQGGLNIPDIRNYINALKLSWISKYQATNHKWKDIAEEIFPHIKKLPLCGPSINSNYSITNKFWSNTQNAYEIFFNILKPNNANELICEPVFCNKKIKVGNKVIRNDMLIRMGKYSIKHFLKENGQFLSYNEFFNGLDYRVDFVTFNGWISSFKEYIKQTGLKYTQMTVGTSICQWH